MPKKPTLKTSKNAPRRIPTKAKKSKADAYGAEQITVLEGLAPVRKRPGMYIGNTAEDGLHHMLWEVVDNGIDEAMAGHCTDIVIKILPDNAIQVIDNGRGIPVEMHKTTKVSALETVLTKLHAGGKFGDGGYKVSGGLHGVGVSVVNALSESLKAEVKRDGKLYEQEYKRGKALKKIKMVGAVKRTMKPDPLYPERAFASGTSITFKPDSEIFTVLEYSWNKILNRLRQQAYLTKGVRIIAFDLRDKAKPKQFSFYFEGGIASYAKQLNNKSKIIHDNVFYIEKETNGINVEIALKYVEEFNETLLPFTNNILNPEGGMHVAGFRTALTRTLNSYARKQNFIKEKDDNLTGDDAREGLTAIISIKLTDPQFEGQTKAKLGNAEVKPAVDSVLSEALTIFFEEHPKDAEAIVGKTLLAARARLASKAARETVLRKGVLDSLSLPGKLADCSSKKPEDCELYIVEGDSAGGCFSADTKVALTDGRNLSFKELIKEDNQGKKNYCYTIKNNGNVGIELIKNPRKTKSKAEVIKIILDNNQEIICTPDHRFMLKDNSYIKAKNLSTNQSLMPLYRKLSQKQGRITIKGYEMIYESQKQQWIFTHLLADAFNLENNIYSKKQGAYKHHLDFNKLNNNPDNIIQMTKEEHTALHAQFAKLTLQTEEAKEKARQAHQKPAYKEKIRQLMTTPQMRAILSLRAKKQWKNPEYKQFMTQKYLEFYENNEEYRTANLARLNEEQKKYWADNKNRAKQALKTKQYFEDNPKAVERLRNLAQQQWQDENLKKWRSQTTQEQWTPEFREIRKTAYNRTYFKHTLQFMQNILKQNGNLDNYDKERINSHNKNLLKKQTFASRFFKDNEEAMLDCVQYYNHKIKKIIKLKDKIDVYDLEIEGTHNFALASGIFVHNSAKQGRSREFQAILPLRGKIINVEKARLDKMLANNEVKSLIIAMGTNIGEQFEIDKLRYHKVIIMTDADVDGSHIRTLLLTLFYRHFQELITNGNLYVAVPPIYQLKGGTHIKYLYDESKLEEELRAFQKIKIEVKKPTEAEEAALKEEIAEKTEAEEEVPAGLDESLTKGIHVQRYKGLGEMNPSQLWETTMDPAGRLLKKVTIEDAVAADEIFDILMGSDVGPRKRFIQTHAKSVKNLDI